MQRRDAYPVGTATGACLVTGDYAPEPEGIIDLDVDLDALPPFGKLCLSAKAVRLMADALGYDLTPKVEVQGLRDELAATKGELEDLRARVQLLVDALLEVADAVPNLEARGATDTDEKRDVIRGTIEVARELTGDALVKALDAELRGLRADILAEAGVEPEVSPDAGASKGRSKK